MDGAARPCALVDVYTAWGARPELPTEQGRGQEPAPQSALSHSFLGLWLLQQEARK